MNHGSALRWMLRLAVLAGAAWFLRPLYAPPVPAVPAAATPDDFVRWTYHTTTNQQVIQSFTVHRDGRNMLLITRQLGDPDVPEKIREWKLRRNKATGLVEFSRENVLDSARSKQLFRDALNHGAWTLADVAITTPERLVIEATGDSRTNRAAGPVSIGSTFDWQPDRWVNRQRWQRVAALPTDLPAVSQWLEKRDFILVDDDGKPITPE